MRSIALFLFLVVSLKSHAFTLVSWNVKHMGRADMDTVTVASLLVNADIVTMQEVNKSPSGQKALTAIAHELQKLTGEKICWALSETPSGSKERFAFLWKNSKIAFVKSNESVIDDCPATALTVRLASKNADHIVREPAHGTFAIKDAAKKYHQRFELASVHLVPSGKSPQKEVAPLFQSFVETKRPLIVAGDFNLDSPHPAFSVAKNLGFNAALAKTKTSLKMKKRELSKPYDNFWVRGLKISNAKVINLYEAFPRRPAREIYDSLSDHSPIQAEFEF